MTQITSRVRAITDECTGPDSQWIEGSVRTQVICSCGRGKCDQAGCRNFPV